MKKGLIYILLFMAAVSSMAHSCTGNFEKYNINPYQPQKLNPEMFFAQMITTGTSVQENDSQHVEQMLAGVFSGYFSMSNSWGNTNFGTYNASDSWNEQPFVIALSKFYPNYFKVQQFTQEKGHFWAMALILRVNTLHRITDCYGPIPYTKVIMNKINVEYDSQELVYKTMFEDLTKAVITLKAFLDEAPGYRPLEGYDAVYNGDYAKWIRYANSLKLRLALRLTNVDPQLAQQMAEEAVNDDGGLLNSNEDNALLTLQNVENPYWKTGTSWNETRINAALMSFMEGYQDPRSSAYFTSSEYGSTEFPYFAMRSGQENVIKSVYEKYSKPNFAKADKVLMFCSAEVAFLRAEGALRGWNMGGTANDFYTKGVELSFSQYAAGSPATYLTNTTLKPAPYAGRSGESQPHSPKSKITIAWENGASFEVNLERIIVQKWIANYTIGFEGWADYRRTGHPEVFPVVNNLSGGIISTQRQQRRLRFPLSEYKGNAANVEDAITLLGGDDTGATDVWWAKKN